MKCNTCETEGGVLLWSVGGYRVYRCPVCDLIYADCSGADLTGLYEEDYYKKVYPDYETDREVHNRNHEAMLERIEHMTTRGRLLEIGSAFGFFIESARRRGWEATGYELSEYASSVARVKYGANVIHADFLDAKIAERYDCVCIFDTIEHVADPKGLVGKVASVLKPGGHLIVSTGDIASPFARVMGKRWRMVQPPLHIYYYCPRSITSLLEKQGFSVESITHDGKYHNLGSIAQHLFGAPKKAFPAMPVSINLGDIMTVAARLKPARRTDDNGKANL
ncbi:MAG: class I SAM-dependent methyltransferase [Nitrospirae bacterium]|nr:class I SAM-dependent methyltransferase [Nitrospirota bacterium]